VYNALALRILRYRHEILIFRKEDKKELTTINMKFLIRTAEYKIRLD